MSEHDYLKSLLCRPMLSLEALRQAAREKGYKPYKVKIIVVPTVLQEKLGAVIEEKTVTIWGKTKQHAIRENGIQ